jgi:hypothetical protein
MAVQQTSNVYAGCPEFTESMGVCALLATRIPCIHAFSTGTFAATFEDQQMTRLSSWQFGWICTVYAYSMQSGSSLLSLHGRG